MTYEEYIEMLQGSGFEGVDKYVDAARDAYDGITAGANARIAELETANSDLQKQLTETQAKNYTLMMAATSKVDPEPDTHDDEPTDEDRDVHSLFAKRGK